MSTSRWRDGVRRDGIAWMYADHEYKEPNIWYADVEILIDSETYIRARHLGELRTEYASRRAAERLGRKTLGLLTEDAKNRAIAYMVRLKEHEMETSQ